MGAGAPNTPGTGSLPVASVFDSVAGDAEAQEPYDEVAQRYKDISGTMSSIDGYASDEGVPPLSQTFLKLLEAGGRTRMAINFDSEMWWRCGVNFRQGWRGSSSIKEGHMHGSDHCPEKAKQSQCV